ncbi:hypothetical protein L9F63_007026, partial [Diploptera punctata]
NNHNNDVIELYRICEHDYLLFAAKLHTDGDDDTATEDSIILSSSNFVTLPTYHVST